jgi:hypothetical protein
MAHTELPLGTNERKRATMNTLTPKPKRKRKLSPADLKWAERLLVRDCLANGWTVEELRQGYRMAREIGGVQISWRDFMAQAVLGEIKWLDPHNPSSRN